MLQEGDKVPVFSGLDQDNKKISSKDLTGKFAIYFYPQDMTETCTIQACNLRDNYTVLKNKKIKVIGISPDSIQSHKKFESKYQLPFPLIADTSHSIIESFGVWGEKKLFGRKYMGLIRTTFLIDKGIIKKVISKPKSKDHVREILEAWESI
ncbi:MAG: thioredoxin-dependent thiol peroxidase [Ferruginibacter sp.]